MTDVIWIPVSERLPKLCVRPAGQPQEEPWIIQSEPVYLGDGDSAIVGCLVSFFEEPPIWCTGGSFAYHGVTHWSEIPLPAGPGQGAAGSSDVNCTLAIPSSNS